MPVLTPTVFSASDYPDLGTIPREGGSWLKKALSYPSGPARTRRIADRCRGVAARLPVADGAPRGVLVAHKEFIATIAQAEAAADALEVAQAAVETSLRTDVDTAGALKKGAALLHTALSRPRARDAAEVAETMTLAAEGAALAALQALLEAVRNDWQEWRVALEEQAGAAIDEAVVAFAAAEAAIGKRGEALERINVLDWEIASRFTDEWEATGRTSDHDGAGSVVLPDHPHPRAARAYLGMTAEVEALRTGLGVAYDWAPAATPPPAEPEMIVEYGPGDLVGKKVPRA